MFHRVPLSTLLLPLLFLAPSAAVAAELSLSGTLTDSCTLSIGSNGMLAAAADGTTLSSEQAGGVAATFTLIAVGAEPVIDFTAPTLQSPAGWSGEPTTAIRYTSLQGANQAYTSGASSFEGTTLIDSFTVHGRVTNQEGFTAGQYTVLTTVTCQQ